MQYSMESISAVRRLAHITMSHNEVAEALDKASSQKHSKGRKSGKSKSSPETSPSAVRLLTEQGITTVLSKEQLIPLSQFSINTGKLKREAEFSFSVEFEVLPDIPVPLNLGDLSVETQEPEPEQADLERVGMRLLKRMGSLSEIQENRRPTPGDVVKIDVSAEYHGKPLPYMSRNDFHYRLAQQEPKNQQNQRQELDEATLSLKKGEAGHITITCPAEYPEQELRGKPISLTVELKGIYEEGLPVIDEQLAQRMGFDNLVELKLHLYEMARKERTRDLYAQAREKLLDKLLGHLEFPLPECLVQRCFNDYLRVTAVQLEEQGWAREDIVRQLQGIKAEAWTEARKEAKEETFLLALAFRENMQVHDEIDKLIKKMAKEEGKAENSLRRQFEESSEINDLQARLLIAKAMDFLYRKARKVFVDKSGQPVEQRL